MLSIGPKPRTATAINLIILSSSWRAFAILRGGENVSLPNALDPEA
jgi:hypothetical protein